MIMPKTMIKLLIIDNYDSFVYNIAQYMGELGVDQCDVIRNDKITLHDIINKEYDAIVISPGPGTPEDPKYFGICLDIITKLGATMPILGVCLGHQGIIHAFGGKVVNAGCVRHGKTSLIDHNGTGIFENVHNPFRATRYHSLVGDKTIIPDVLEITASAMDDGEIMAIKHTKYPIEGVQFHPESIMTQDGKTILGNFLKHVKEFKAMDTSNKKEREEVNN